MKDLTIITITFNNKSDLIKTYNSLEGFRNSGGTHIIINGGKTVKSIVKEDCHLYEERDNGIYDALNKGISKVNTSYFMLIHSGDILVVEIDILQELINKMKIHNYDILLNNCSINYGSYFRAYNSNRWRPWMIRFGVQPPHPPIIYKREAMSKLGYNQSNSTIADFEYLESIFKDKVKYGVGNQLLVEMCSGGKTSSGLSSFFHVNKEFLKLKGLKKALVFSLSRPLIKIYLILK